jgi:hypothetical protein
MIFDLIEDFGCVLRRDADSSPKLREAAVLALGRIVD